MSDFTLNISVSVTSQEVGIKILCERTNGFNRTLPTLSLDDVDLRVLLIKLINNKKKEQILRRSTPH